MSEKKSKLGIWAAFGKLGGKLISLILKMFKGLKFAKIGLAGASFAGYAALYSWKFALLLMIAIGFHEAGHVWEMKKMGIKTKGFYFLPFIGGAAIAEESYKTYGQNSFISIMGPLWGAALAYVCGALYLITNNPLWACAAAWMSTLNLFNLLPICPLDGGQILRAISFSINKKLGVWFLAASLILATIIMLTLKMGLFALILFVGGIELFLEIRKRVRAKKRAAFLKERDAAILNMKKIMNTPDPALGEYEEYPFENYSEETLSYPENMNKNQLILTCLSYVGTIVVLVVLLKLTQHIPGADLAHNFFE